MKRGLLTTRLALEALFGIFILFECASVVVTSPRRITSIAVIVGIPLGIGLIADAFRVRRMLNRLDASLDSPQEK